VKRFNEYVKMREENQSAQQDDGASPVPEKGAPDTLITAMKIACDKYKNRTKQFLKELNDSDIDKVLGQLSDDVDDDFTGPVRRSERDRSNHDNMVMIPKADGNSGADGGGED